jgi:hypothetical protein
MNNYSKVERGVVRIEHNSTASLLKVFIGKTYTEDSEQVVWLDYGQAMDLLEALKVFEE